MLCFTVVVFSCRSVYCIVVMGSSLLFVNLSCWFHVTQKFWEDICHDIGSVMQLGQFFIFFNLIYIETRYKCWIFYITPEAELCLIEWISREKFPKGSNLSNNADTFIQQKGIAYRIHAEGLYCLCTLVLR